MATFGRMKNFLANRSINLKSRKRMLKCYVYSVLYSFETLTFSAQAIKRLEACEMWFYRRMSCVPWVQKIMNTEVLRRAKTEQTVIEIIKKWKMGYFNLIITDQKYEILHPILQGKIKGQRGRGRRKLSWTQNIRSWSRITSFGELIRVTEKEKK